MHTFPTWQADYYDTFPDFFRGIAEKFHDKPAISWFDRHEAQHTITYGSFADNLFVLALALKNLGLAGAHVAIVSENTCEWLTAYAAVTVCGGVAVCVDIEQSDESIRAMLRMADCTALFASTTYIPICAPLFAEGQLAHIIRMDDEEQPENTICFADLLSEGQALYAQEQAPASLPAVTPRQTASIVFTSGTTSDAKAVMLSHQAILHNASDARIYLDLGDRIFSHLPFYHTYGLTCAVFNTLVRGAQFFLNGDLRTVTRDLRLARPTCLITVPLMAEAIHNQIWLEAEKTGKAAALHRLFRFKSFCYRLGLHNPGHTLSSIREKSVGSLGIIICGGAHLSQEISEEFQLMGVLPLQGYGITECSPLVSVNSNHSCRLGSVGHVLPGIELKLVDEEIWVKSKCIMNGYYKRPDLDAEVLSDGWFKTGDVGYVDKDGFLFITGRKKNLIVFKNGKKVSPEKIEELIRPLPLVKDVVVYGAISGISADDVKLAVSIYPDPERAKELSSYEILEALQTDINEINSSLPLYQQIQMVSIREQEFSKTSMKKIKRHLI